MDNNTIQQIKDVIAKSSSIGIAAPKNPSMDEMAAALSMYLLLKNSGKNVSIASPSDPIVEVASLVGIDKVAKSLSAGGGSGDLTVSFPYTEGEIEKVSYTLEEGYLNIIVKAAEQGLSFDEKDVEYARGGGKLDLVFAIGTSNLSDLDTLFDTQNPDTKIVNIDNKDGNEQYGDINLVSNRLSSLSEGVADLALSLDMHIDEDSAQNLFNGIIDATENFQHPKTSSLAFEMTSLLMKKGATRVVSESARRGIKIEDRPQSLRSVRPQNANTARPAEPVPAPNKRVQSQQNFEETLQKRIAEEKAREAGLDPTRQVRQPKQANQPAPVNQPRQASQPVTEDYQDDVTSDDDAPNDWLAPKVYKGSSEV
ncbi:MAG TPA: hypothetical protein VM077_05035 [Candidatus Limnocylindrales bacterium]|nr:hypothetical protein [Candidatus Limnocylindrales bacterium]